jgi:aspartyl-tRNA(Asn)/glutamyl-tRNA(Gln) amidotransferase subunit A
MELTSFTIKQIHQGLLEKKFSVLELTKLYLEKIKKEDKYINAFLDICEDKALEQAKETDRMIALKKEIPLLAGILFGVKDNILVEGVQATASSKILKNYIAPYDATCIKRLKKQGAIILGKTNLDEFAMGSSTENSALGPTKNPKDLTRVPGGSSGGSAAAVASNFCHFALGSDTGGSIRQPASFCGVVGLSPTYGAVSRYGLIALTSSLDQIGQITKTVEDCKIIFDIIKGEDDLDSTSASAKQLIDSDIKTVKDLVIGIPKEYFIEGIDAGVLKLIKEAIKKYEKLGAKTKEISLNLTKYALACYYIINPSEVSANLARYDGIKYGHSADTKDSDNLLEVYLKSRQQGFGDEVKRRIMIGTFALSSGYYEAYYLRAQKVKELIKKDFEKAFNEVDVIFTPVSPTPAFKIGERTTDLLEMYLSDIFTVSGKLAGIPAISVPCGEVNGLPVGLQIIGKSFEDDKIIKVAEFLEK